MREVYDIMAWRQPEYSKKKIDKAGWQIIKSDQQSDEYQESLQIIDNWRASHGYPLYVIGNRLKKMIKDKNSFVVYRLKRLDSIIGKLQRNKNMSLSGMQDIGGCRVVVPAIDDVYEFANNYENSRIRHELCKENDYILYPKTDGYRSLHRVYRYNSDNVDSPYNKMKIEIQFRTQRQHYWATAVETMSICTKTNLKAGIGDENYKRFFVLTSNLLAISEDQNLVPNTPHSVSEIIKEIKDIDKKYHILNKLKTISATVINVQDIKNVGYYLLDLDLDNFLLNIKGFKTNEFKRAVE